MKLPKLTKITLQFASNGVADKIEASLGIGGRTFDQRLMRCIQGEIAEYFGAKSSHSHGKSVFDAQGVEFELQLPHAIKKPYTKH